MEIETMMMKYSSGSRPFGVSGGVGIEERVPENWRKIDSFEF